MVAALIGEQDFVALFEKHGAAETAERLGTTERSVYQRRANLERKLGRPIVAPGLNDARRTRFEVEHPERFVIEVQDGWGIVGSDAHYWPGPASTAHRAFVHFASRGPRFVIFNGDSVDGAKISRFAPIGWEDRPDLVNEIEAAKERMGEVEKAAPGAIKVWCLGNHDSRFETRLATVAPEYARINGVHLKDHFPVWEPCWLAAINPFGDRVFLKHDFRGGIHARHNNSLWAGCHIGTGHLHRLGVHLLDDYQGRRYSFETGMLADVHGRQFVDYTRGNPLNWQSGFVVLTFRGGRLMLPEIVEVIDEGRVSFRGEIIEV
jgi:hypothetical protein